MKKITGLLIGAIILISLAGCTTNQWTTQPRRPAPQQRPTPTPPTPVPTLPTTQPQKEPTAGAHVTQNITIQNLKFTPSNVTIKIGTTVTWTNQDKSPHIIASNDKMFNGNLHPKGTFSYTFNKAGTYDYHCNIHRTMTGTIIVQ